MKIAVWHNLPSGGAKRALYLHVKGLVKRGHTVEIWRPSTADSRYLPLGELAPEHVLPLSLEAVSDSSPLTQLRWALFHMFRNLERFDQHCRQCAAEINSGGFDLLFANSSLLLSVAPIARYVSIPKALYLQEPNRTVYEANPRLPWMGREPVSYPWLRPGEVIGRIKDAAVIKYFRRVVYEEWRNIRAFDMVLANSFYSRESILKAYGVDAHVCYLGIDTEQFRITGGGKRENTVVGVGSFSPLKNVDFVIKALARVGSPRPRLQWIGNFTMGAHLDELRTLARANAVDFEPVQLATDDEMIAMLNRAGMMAYAPRLEPFGLAPLEANACGLPVVAVAEGGIRETVVDGRNGLLVEPDQAAMAVAIARIRDDEEFAAMIGKTGRAMVEERWSWESASDRLEARFQQLVARARTHA